jgi:hypothetical protein
MVARCQQTCQLWSIEVVQQRVKHLLSRMCECKRGPEHAYHQHKVSVAQGTCSNGIRQSGPVANAMYLYNVFMSSRCRIKLKCYFA